MGKEALELFDTRLARAAEVLQSAKFWRDVLESGGSHADLLRSPSAESAVSTLAASLIPILKRAWCI